jgi:hypothetical protein
MKNLYIILFGLFLLQPSYADVVDTELEYDEIRIGYIPSRVASFKGEPHKIFEAKSLIHHEKTEIAEFFVSLSNLASKGITDNATKFHEPTIYIEVIYQRESVRLFYSGDSQLEKYRDYEQSWKSLQKAIYGFLSKELSPDHRFNSTP